MATQLKLGYRFHNDQLRQNALTHSSYANENREKGVRSNERLEFLGDAVLGFICAEYIYSHFRHMPEGELTKLRASIVCGSFSASSIVMFKICAAFSATYFTYAGRFTCPRKGTGVM